MKDEKLKQKLQTGLPINRKERFYTGTVLPSILFHNGLSNLFRFLREIEGSPTREGKGVREKGSSLILAITECWRLRECFFSRLFV